MAALTLRVLTNAGDTTKGAPLTNAEIDQNFINIDTDLGTKAPSDSATLTNVAVNSGAINNTSVGATTRSTGAFTTLTANGATTLTANVSSTSTTTGTLIVTGGAGVSGRVTANDFVGQGSGITQLAPTNLSASVPINKGGTNGTATPTAGTVAYGTGTAYAFTAAGTAGQILQSNGASAPTWITPASGVTLSDDDSANVRYPIFASGSGTLSVGYIDSSTTALSYVPSTGTLSATVFSGSGASLSSLNATQLTTGTVPGDRGVTAGSTTASFVEYNGATVTAGQFDGSTTAPTATTRLNYGGYFYATRFYGDGSNLTALSATNVSSGTLAVARGGTGAGTLTGLVKGNGTSAFTAAAAGTDYMAPASTINIGTTNFALNRASGAQTLNGVSIDGNADTVTNGVYTTGDQSISGNKTFTNTTNSLVASTGTSGYGAFSANGSGTNVAYYFLGNVASGERTRMWADNSRVFRVSNDSGTTTHLTLDASGNLTASANVTAYSDIRLKTDLNRITEAIEKIKQLNGYTFTRIDSGERQTGVVAQEVQKVLPEAVIDTGEHLSVAYGNMVGLLIEAVKELTVRVEQLESR